MTVIVEFIQTIYNFIKNNAIIVISVCCVISIILDVVLSFIIIGRKLRDNKNIPLAKVTEEQYHFDEVSRVAPPKPSSEVLDDNELINF